LGANRIKGSKEGQKLFFLYTSNGKEPKKFIRGGNMKRKESKNKRMKVITMKKCPYCKSHKVVSAGVHIGAGPSPQVTTEGYTCIECGEKFIGPIGLDKKL
jgi:DNA-directed RNA polymerase subunit M/transcription elongation factor TFIIS